MKTTCEAHCHTSLAQRIAAEDIKPGDYLSVLNEMVEFPSFLWSCGDSMLPADEPVRICFMPREPGRAFKVVSVCIPFVYAKNPQGKLCALDTRLQQVVKLNPKTGRLAWKLTRNANRD